MSYKHPLPDAPIALSMLPRATSPQDTDLLYLVRPGNPLGQRCFAIERGALVGSVQDSGWVSYANNIASLKIQTPLDIIHINVPAGSWVVDFEMRCKLVSTYPVTSGTPGYWRRVGLTMQYDYDDSNAYGYLEEITHNEETFSLTGDAGDADDKQIYLGHVTSPKVVLPNIPTSDRKMRIFLSSAGNMNAMDLEDIYYRVRLIPAKVVGEGVIEIQELPTT